MNNNTPIRIAIVLEYNGETAPKVTAKGVNDIADKIIDIATEHGNPMQKNDGLVNILSAMDLGEEIPEIYTGLLLKLLFFLYS